jgi:hypothetical protein
MSRFQSFWFGETLPPYQRLAMKSFVDFGHKFVLFAYRQFDVPAGVELRDAREILPESRLFFYSARAGAGRGSVAGFSNLFRYKMLYEMGDWWVDADVVCLSEAIPTSDIFMSWEYEDLIGSAILKFPRRFEFVRALCDSAESAGVDLEWGITGPHLLTRLAGEHNLLVHVRPQPLGYPVQSMDALHVLMPARRDEVHERTHGKPFLHIWNEVFRRAVIFPWMAPPPGCFVADLFKRHGVGFGNAPVYTPDDVQRLNDNYYATAIWSHEYAERAELARQEARSQRAQIAH